MVIYKMEVQRCVMDPISRSAPVTGSNTAKEGSFLSVKRAGSRPKVIPICAIWISFSYSLFPRVESVTCALPGRL